jgi:hypothetical protein
MADRHAIAIVLGLVLLAKLTSGRSDPWWLPEYSGRKPGRKDAGKGSTRTPVPSGAADVWSEDTMRLFVTEMRKFGIDPAVVLKGIAAASSFRADEALGGYVGLLMVSREDLNAIGYSGVPPFEELDAPAQIPWLSKVIGYRLASTGAVGSPRDVPELAALLHPADNPTIDEVIRKEAARRAEDVESSMLYIAHKTLLQKVLANRDPRERNPP